MAAGRDSAIEAQLAGIDRVYFDEKLDSLEAVERLLAIQPDAEVSMNPAESFPMDASGPVPCLVETLHSLCVTVRQPHTPPGGRWWWNPQQ